MSKLFITGVPGIGKTTICDNINTSITQAGNTVSGFTTKEIRENDKRVGFLLTCLSTNNTCILAHVDEERTKSRYSENREGQTSFKWGSVGKYSAFSNLCPPKPGIFRTFSEEFLPEEFGNFKNVIA